MPLSNQRRAELMAGPYTRLLAEHETGLADLYSTFADILPGQADFWNAIAKEERGHRKLIEGIDEKLREGAWTFKRPSFVSTDIAQSIEWAREIQLRAEKNGISMREALKLAVGLERSSIEHQFFQVVDGDSPAMMDAIQSLANYTRAHQRQIEKEASRLKWKILGGRTVHLKAKTRASLAERRNFKANAKAAQAEMLGMMIALEEATSHLYTTYANRLYSMKGFWGRLAAEEMQHAAMLRELYKILDDGKLFYNVERFNHKELERDVNHVLDLETQAHHSGLSPYKAVNHAIEIERLLTEARFYVTVKSDSLAFQHIAKRMVELSEEHVRRLETEMGRVMEMGENAAIEV